MIYLFEACVGLTGEGTELDKIAGADAVVPEEFDAIV